MSKYIKLEDVENEINHELEWYKDPILNSCLTVTLECIKNLPTIEVSGGDLGDAILLTKDAYSDLCLRASQVSEDCISRSELIEKFEELIKRANSPYLKRGIRWAIGYAQSAPSVVPTTEQSCDTCRHNKCEWDSKECDGCTKANSNYEPTTGESEE